MDGLTFPDWRTQLTYAYTLLEGEYRHTLVNGAFLMATQSRDYAAIWESLNDEDYERLFSMVQNSVSNRGLIKPNHD